MLDYETLAQSRLTGKFADNPKMQALIAAIVAPLTLLETAADQLMSERWIDTAVGLQLDGAGSIVGELRRGRDDDTYREAIRFRVIVNISQATPGDLINGLQILTAPTDSQYLAVYPATALLFSNGYFIDSNTAEVMFDLYPAGVSHALAVSYADAPFRFAKESAPGELFVTGDDYLTAEGSDIQVSAATVATGASTLGGCVPAELSVGGDIYLDIGGGPTLAVYSPDHLETIGHYNLTGVYQ
jgi:hypothetical protein